MPGKSYESRDQVGRGPTNDAAPRRFVMVQVSDLHVVNDHAPSEAAIHDMMNSILVRKIVDLMDTRHHVSSVWATTKTFQ